MILPSGSRLSLGMKCMGSFLLPQVKSEPGEAAEKGTAFHALVDKYCSGSRTAPASASEIERSLLRQIGERIGPSAEILDISELACVLYPCDRRAELRRVWRSTLGETFFYDVDVGRGAEGVRRRRELSISDSQAHNNVQPDSRQEAVLLPVGSNDVTGDGTPPGSVEVDRSSAILAIADLVQVHSAQEVSIWDWKTGGWAGDPAWSYQLIAPALTIWCGLGCPDDFIAKLTYLYCDLESGECKPDTATLRSSDLERHLGSLARLVAKAQKADPSTVTLYEGKHCGFCPARDRCPAKIGALTKAMENFLWADVGDKDYMQGYIALKESSFSNNKVAYEILERHNNVVDLGDGRDAVLTVKSGRRSVYTRKHVEEKNVQQDGSDVAEDDSSEPASK